MKRFSPVVAAAVVLGSAMAAQAVDFSTGFEGASPLTGWTTSGSPTINTDLAFVRSGTQSLKLDAGSGASYIIDAAEQYGTLTMWIYDAGQTMSDYTKTANGPSWGGFDNANEVFVDQLWNRSYASDTATNYHYDASDNTGPFGSRFTGWGSPSRIYNDWNEFVFDRPDASTLTLSVNGRTPVVIPNDSAHQVAGWLAGAGFSGIGFYGGKTDTTSAQLGGIYVDDVSFVAASVPEPASLALLGLGAGGLLMGRRRRR
jgi:hypothetical protein